MNTDESLEEFAEHFSRQVRSGHLPTADGLEEEFLELTDDLKGFVKTLSILEEAGFRHRIRGPAASVVDAAGQRWTRLGGFRLIREISRGGMGIIYEAEQEALQRRVAIKVLPSNPMLTENQLARFKREGTAIARLHHSHIVPVFGSGEQNGVHYCVMQYIEGCSLDRLIRVMRQRYIGDDASELAADLDPDADEVDVRVCETLPHDQHIDRESRSEYPSFEALKVLVLDEVDTQGVEHQGASVRTMRPKQKKSRLPNHYWKNVARIGADMADALSHAHSQGVLHRDVKPGNLLVDKTGHMWLADFGVAKLADHDNLTLTGGVIGTLRYTPPEQFEGKSDARSDVYSLALTLYELCALQPAFAAKDRRELMRQITETTPQQLSQIMPGIPADLETVINKAMAPAPADRYQKASDLAEDLRRFIADRSITARRFTIVERGWRWCCRHRTETALGTVIAVLLISFGVTASVAYFREAKLRQESEYTARTAISAVNRVYDSYVPDWTTSSTVSAHGSISVSPGTAQQLAGLLQFYDDLAQRTSHTTDGKSVFEATAAFRRVALIYHRLGMFEESKDAYGQALVRLRSWTPQSLSPHVQLEHARLNNEIGSVYWTERQISNACEAHQNAMVLLQNVDVRKDPGLQSEILFEKARTGYLLGRRARGRQGGAPLRPVITRQQELFDKQSRSLGERAKIIAESVEILRKLIEQSTETQGYRHLLALSYCELTDNPADPDVKKAIDVLEQLVREDPQNPAYRYSLCSTLLWLDLSANSDDEATSRAAEYVARAIDIAENLAQERPDEWIYPAVQVEAHLLMAQVHSFRGKPNEAHESCRRAVDLGKHLFEKYPRCLSFRYWVGSVLHFDGEILLKSGQHESALQSYDEAMQIFREVLHNKPNWGHVVFRDLKNTCNSRAKALIIAGSNDEATEAQLDSAEYATKLAQALASTP